MPAVVVIDRTAGAAPTLDRPRPERLEAGNPQRWTWLLHEAGPMSAGVWACEVGRWRIAFPPTKQEYFFVLEGLERLHGADGTVVDVAAGQGAVIPPGFEGAFEVVRPVRKQFVVVDLQPVP
jgi:uncharacterized cupin superfamily protein